MNEGDQARLEGFRALLCTDGTRLSRVKSPQTSFEALLNVNPPFDVPSELIDDPREKALMEVESPGPVLVKSDTLKDVCGNIWQIWRRDNNPADFTVKYWLTKVTQADT